MNFSVKSALAMLAVAATGLASAATVTLTGTVRDFAFDGRNFQGPITSGSGWVSSTLIGTAPTLTATGNANIENNGSAGSFNNWYSRPFNAANTVNHQITLNETAPNSGLYRFSSNMFFPIDGRLLGNEGRDTSGVSRNFGFTYNINATFGYTKGAGQTFSFTGDDDVWVYFDKMLGIDLGGVHSAQTTTINLDTLFAGTRESGNYSFNFFSAERHTDESNLMIETSLNLVSTPNPIPEPGSLALLGLGLVGLAAARKRKQA